LNGFYAFLDRLIPATVNIHAFIPDTNPSASILGRERLGSGTIIDDAGHILTVGYVVLGARQIIVHLQTGEQMPARIVDMDFDSGLAVLYADVPGLPGIALGDSSSVERGQTGLVVASTGPAERCVTEGIITSLDPFDAYWEYMLERAILTTAVNRGFGGGAFVTLAGVMVGVMSLNLGGLKDWSMIIPLDAFHRIKDDLLLHGQVSGRVSRAWLGLSPMPSPRGLVVFGLTANGPAERAGVRAGDIILSLNGHEVIDRPDLYRRLWEHRAGAEITLGILREGAMRTMTVQSQDRAIFFR
jgi:S1-C subfamily serine protease